MSALRALRKGLDPWAALLLGILVTLAVVILLATPGPWHQVVGLSPPAALASLPPEDIAVFVRGAGGGDCTGIVWLHIDHKRVSLTATVVAPQTQGRVSGGGYVPLRRIVDDLGPQVAAAALGAVLKVELDAWVTLDRDALRLAVPTMFAGTEERPRLQLYRMAAQAWSGAGGSAAWFEQYETLSQALPLLPLEDLNVVAFANYVLGFGIMQNELDLQAATSVAETLRVLRPGHVRVRACPAVVDVCRGGESWSLQTIPLRHLRHDLMVGLTPAVSKPDTVVRRRPARVLVVLPDGGLDAVVYVREVRRRLALVPGAPVAVRAVTAKPAALSARVEDVVAEWRPLAVLVAPPRADLTTGATEAMAGALRDLGAVLEGRRQPAVMSLPLVIAVQPAESANAATLTAAIQATSLPASRISSMMTEDVAARARLARIAARANVQTLVRACWPQTLAPALTSTRMQFSYAACRQVAVGVFAPTYESGERVVARLRLWGYQAELLSATDWRSGVPEPGLYHREGLRRPALALGGDLGLERDQIVLTDGAPADLTVVLSD